MDMQHSPSLIREKNRRRWMGTIDRRIANWDVRAARSGKAQTDTRTVRLRLGDDQYRRLTQFIISREDRTGRRFDHRGGLSGRSRELRLGL
jgi:hypothetical protein